MISRFRSIHVMSGSKGARLASQRIPSRFSAVLVALIFALSGLSPASPVRAAEDAAITEAPRKLIDETAAKIVSILAQKDLPAEKRVGEIESLAYEIFDFTTMSKLVLARNWRKMDKEKRAEFVREFKRHLSHTYGTRLDRYDQEQVVVYAAQVEVRDDVTIKTRIEGGNSTPEIPPLPTD